MKRLFRSSRERMIGGVCGGLAEYFNIDPTLVRLAFVALALLGGNGVLIYLVLLILVPNEPDASDTVIDAAPPTSQDDHPTI